MRFFALLLHATGASALAGCASYCHWEEANCRKDPSACGGCDMCKKLQDAPHPVVVQAPATPVSSGICAAWCSPHHFETHCDNSDCRECAFCPTESYKSCGAWCREGNGIYAGQCTDQRCLGCALCGGSTETCTPIDMHDMAVASCENWCKVETARDHCKRCSCKTCTWCPKPASISNPSPPRPRVQQPPPSPPPVVEEKWLCYAQRYHDILQVFNVFLKFSSSYLNKLSSTLLSLGGLIEEKWPCYAQGCPDILG